MVFRKVKSPEAKKITLQRVALFLLPIPLLQGVNLKAELFDRSPANYPATAEANFSGKFLKLQVADSDLKLSQGLVGQKSLQADRGVIYELGSRKIKPEHSMQGMLFSTDLVFLSRGKVAVVLSNLPTCPKEDLKCPTYRPNIPYDQVLELKGGLASALGLEIGQKIKINYRKIYS
jgi:uncharacterized membrane protein (UPF0127 family)